MHLRTWRRRGWPSATREEEFSQHVEAEKVAGRSLADAEERVSALTLEENNLEQRLQSKVKAYAELVESQASQQAQWETKHRARVERAEYDYSSVKVSVMEKERMVGMMDQTLEVKKEEDKRASRS